MPWQATPYCHTDRRVYRFCIDPHLRRVRMSRRGHLRDGCPFGQLRQDLLERPADLTVGGGLGGTTTVRAHRVMIMPFGPLGLCSAAAAT